MADGGPNVAIGRVIITTASSVARVVWLVEQRLVTKPRYVVELVISSVDKVLLA